MNDPSDFEGTYQFQLVAQVVGRGSFVEFNRFHETQWEIFPHALDRLHFEDLKKQKVNQNYDISCHHVSQLSSNSPIVREYWGLSGLQYFQSELSLALTLSPMESRFVTGRASILSEMPLKARTFHIDTSEHCFS